MSRMGSASGTREGDWKCDGCGNRNYAFRSFCNRCKQPRFLVDSKTPSDSKWLPRIGDWICTGCSNNNYASREKCNKCGEPKEVAALAATALHGAALTAPGLAYHSADHTGGLGMNYHTGGPGMNLGSAMTSIPSWPGALDWPSGSTADGGNWHPGDWLCACGYHNYPSCLTCKQCQAPMPIQYFNPGAPLPSIQPPVYSGLGVKRSAPDDLGSDFVNKRLHVGGDYAHHPPLQSQGHNFSALPGLGVSVGITGGGTLPSYDWTMPPPPQPSGAMIVPTIIGKGAKQWRAGDWMCSGCNNHNFASRLTCNRCGGQKEIMAQPLPVA